MYDRPIMSALDGWIDICRTGTFTDARGRKVTLEAADLDRLAEGYKTQDPAPVVVGHPETDAPAWGWIDAVRRSGDRLQARLRDIAPAFREAVEAGRYAGRSIAFTKDGLRHLGFLGGRAPAVPGLSPSRFSARFSAPADTVIEFAGSNLAVTGAARTIARTLGDLMRSLRERTIASDGPDAADRAFPQYAIERMKRLADAIETHENGDADSDATPAMADPNENAHQEDRTLSTKKNAETGTDPNAGTGNDTGTDAAALAAQDARLKALATDLEAREQRLNAAEKAAADAAALAEAEKIVDEHVAAGRVLPAEKPALAALLSSLPDGDDARIEFCGGKDGANVREAPRSVLKRLLAAIPRRVNYGEFAGPDKVPPAGDGGGAGNDAAIAADARALMAEAAERGESVTALEAVDRVRAKRGLQGN